jgi:hypothetical protein
MPQHTDAAHRLTDNHRRRIYATCQHLDKLLNAIERAMDPARAGDPFLRYEHVLSPHARAGMLDVVRGFRASIVSVLDRYRIPLPPANQDRFTVQSTIQFIDADIVDLRPEHMGGYGELSDAAGADLTAIVQEFSGHLSALRGVLEQDTPGAPRPGTPLARE